MIRLLDDRSSELNDWSEKFLTMVENIFFHDGNLTEQFGFEYRPEQEEMAIAVAHSLLSDTNLVVEAGTGVGKSLAYLIPAVLFARLTKRTLCHCYQYNKPARTIAGKGYSVCSGSF